MANKLKKLQINRVDLVDKPSNPLARVLLYKREVEKNLYGAKTTDGVMHTEMFWDHYYKILNAFRTSVDSILYSTDITDDKRVEMLKASVSESATHLTNLFDAYPVEKGDKPENDEIYDKVEKTVDVLNELDTLVGSGEISVKEITDILEGLEMADKKTETNEIEATLKAEVAAKVTALETAGAEIAKLQKEVAELKKTAGSREPEVEDIWKGVNPAIRAQFEELKKAAEASAKVAKESEENAAMVKLTKRVSEELVGIEGTIDEKTALLRSVEKVAGSKLFEALYKTLKSASETIKKSELVTEKGRTGTTQHVGNTAFDKIKSQAKQMVEKGTAKSEAAAIAIVARQSPELYKEYLEEGVN